MNARLKEAYRFGLSCGHIARQRRRLRAGGTVRLRIDEGVGFSDGVPEIERSVKSADFQLRFVEQAVPARYGVCGQEDDGTWHLVDGPWDVGKGPFD